MFENLNNTLNTFFLNIYFLNKYTGKKIYGMRLQKLFKVEKQVSYLI